MSDDIQNKKLGTCHACGGTVSKTAKVCPHCGEKKPYQPPKNWKKIFLYSFIGMLLYGFMQVIVSLSSNPNYQASPSPTQSSSVEDAVRACEAGIRASVNNPSTVDVHRFTGFANNIDAAGTRRITQTFSAKNSFGLKQTFDAYCSLTSAGKFDIKIVEQGR